MDRTLSSLLLGACVFGTTFVAQRLIAPYAGLTLTLQIAVLAAALLGLAAGMLAFSAPWRLRLVGLLVGTIAVQGLNLVRVVSLFYLGQWNFQAFEFAHLYLWQALIMLDVLIVWLLWLRWVGREHASLVIPAQAGIQPGQSGFPPARE